MQEAVGPELQVRHSDLEGLEWAAEVVCRSWAVTVAAVPQVVPCMQRAGMVEPLVLALVPASDPGAARAPLPLQILDVALGQEHLTQTVV